MVWSPPYAPSEPDAVVASLDAALSTYSNEIQSQSSFTFLGLIWPAYQELHSAVRRQINAAFASLNAGGQSYQNSFTMNAWSKKPLLNGIADVLTVGGDAFSQLAADYSNLLQLEQAIAAGGGSSLTTSLAVADADVLSQSIAFFDSYPVFAVLSQSLTTYITNTAALIQSSLSELGTASASSAVSPVQEAALYILVIPFAFQAIYSSISARDLYEIDGNVGVRAAAAKLGGQIVGESERAAPEPELLGLNSVGSLGEYMAAVWSTLGLTLPETCSEVDITQRSASSDLANLSTVLLEAELGSAEELPTTTSIFLPDRLEDWSAPRTYPEGNQVVNTAKWELPVSPHLTESSDLLGTTSVVTFAPTWLALLNEPQLLKYQLNAQPNVLYAHPLAHLCIYVAAALFTRSAAYLDPPPAPGSAVTNQAKPSALRINAACLEFGGRHAPHKTHRSGYEIDVFLGGNPRVLTSDITASNASHAGQVVRDQVKNNMNQPSPCGLPANANYPPGDITFDWYGNDKDDTPYAVATARSLVLSLYLSGCNRVIFNDPWIFVDVFYFLRCGLTRWVQDLKKNKQELPSLFGSDKISLASWQSGISLVPNHNTHMHAEWSLVHTGSGQQEQISLAPKFLETWISVWAALGIQATDLTNVLRDLQDRSRTSQATQTLIQGMIRVLGQRQPAALTSLYTYIYEGESGQNWLTTNVHGPVAPPPEIH